MRCRNPSCDSETASQVCTKCRMYIYCSPNCQRSHWPYHKVLCGKASSTTIGGYTLSEIEHNEFSQTPILAENSSFSEWQLHIRTQTARGFGEAVEAGFPIETRPVYAKFPSWKFYVDIKHRPVRIFGVMNFRSAEPRVHTISLRKDGSSFFTVGGVLGKDLTCVKSWDEEALASIMKSKVPGLFLDPLGNQIASSLAEDTGYAFLSDNMCSCCGDNGSHLPTDRPVLLSDELMQARSKTRVGR